MKGKYLLPVLMMLTGAQSAVCARELTVLPGHWQRDMGIGVAEFTGTIFVRNAAWQWQPQPLQADGTATSLNLNTTPQGYDTPAGSKYTVLAGHTTGLMTAKPGLRPVVTLAQRGTSSATPVRGELAGGGVRYGEMTFKVQNVLAYQDRAMSGHGWRVAQGGQLAPDVRQQVVRQLWQVQGYHYRAIPASGGIGSDVFTRTPDSVMIEEGDGADVAGAWLTMLEDIKVRFPPADTPVKRWQGNLTPVVMYF